MLQLTLREIARYFCLGIVSIGALLSLMSKDNIFLPSFFSAAISLMLTLLFSWREYVSYRRGNETNLISLVKAIPIPLQNQIIREFVYFFKVGLILVFFFFTIEKQICYILHQLSGPKTSIKEYEVTAYNNSHRVRYRGPTYSIVIENGDDFASRNSSIGISAESFHQIEGKSHVKVTFEAAQTIFGTSVIRNFAFKSINGQGSGSY